jgi:hypothetical protein
MFKRTAVLLTIPLFSLMLLLGFARSARGNAAAAPSQATLSADRPQPADLLIHRRDDGMVSLFHPMVLGPDICSQFGDPYSPLNPTWEPLAESALYQGLYTYTYRINIPADYPYDVVRVELFDPDSINQPNNDGSSFTTTITHTAPWIADGRPAVETLSCTSSRTNPCLIDTREDDLLTLPVDNVNPWWLVRMDANRIGPCGSGNYTPSSNTQTIFELSYQAQTVPGFSENVLLGRYVGQVEDGVRDNGDHLTDLRWVSPGGQSAYDQPAPVPAESGSFEIDLRGDVPGIVVDPLTGDRSLYLGVTAVSGASENGWDVWAGPPTYLNTISSDVNTRNVQVINNPGAHQAYGIEIYALDAAPTNHLYTDAIDMPLLELGPEYAGQEVYVSLFDSDAGSRPPIIFTFDTLAAADWNMTFGSDPATHPDNAPDYDTSGRCPIGSCNNSWVWPYYKLTIPTYDPAACAADPTNQAVCTPFYGGRLTANFQGRTYDSYVWKLIPPEPVYQSTQACSAFPLAPFTGIRSLTQAAYNQLAASVSYPFTLPAYDSFPHHADDVPMLLAQPGYLYQVRFDSTTGFWLRWNSGIVDGSTTLANSFTWPGDTLDYADHGDGGTALPPFPHVVRGFMEAGDSSDQSLNAGDYVPLNVMAALTETALQTVLQEQIDLNRVLRLPLTGDNTPAWVGGGPAVQTSAFGLFRIVGYSESDGWLLLTFAGWDESCGQTAVPPSSVTLNGPTSGVAHANYTFTAAVSPADAALPLTYVWSAAEQEPITQTGNTETALTFQWASSGVKTITVTAQNPDGGPLTATRQITLTSPANLAIGPLELVTTPPITAAETVVFRTTISNTGETAVTSQFFVDLFINPTEIHDEYIPLEQSSGYTAVFGLAAETSQVITLTAALGFPPQVPTHTVYAMVDSLRQIAEPDESDNVSAPLTVTNVLPPPPSLALTPDCSSAPQADLTAVGQYWPANEQISLFFDGALRGQLLPVDGAFSLSWQETITVGENYVVTAVSASHTVSETFATPCTPAFPANVTISGPTAGPVGEPLTFIATIAPDSAVQPLTYTWRLSETNLITHTNGLSDTLTYTWDTLGVQGFGLIVENEYGRAYGRYQFEIVEQQLFLPIIAKPPACEQHTAALSLDIEPTAVSPTDPITLTATLENNGCVSLGLPEIRLTADPALISPANFLVKLVDVGQTGSVLPGDSWIVDFPATAVSPGSLIITGSASFEVHPDYPIPPYWGHAGTSKAITISP